MSHNQVKSQKSVPGFWTRLAMTLEEAFEPYEEQLERRVARLEREVRHAPEGIGSGPSVSRRLHT